MTVQAREKFLFISLFVYSKKSGLRCRLNRLSETVTGNTLIGNLRTFTLKISTTQIFVILWLQSDNGLPLSEMQKKGGHRLRFRNKARVTLPQF